MRAQIDRDKRLPQFYISVFVTDKEFERMEQETNPRELFKGLTSGQVMAAATAGMVYGMMLKSEEEKARVESKRIEVAN